MNKSVSRRLIFLNVFYAFVCCHGASENIVFSKVQLEMIVTGSKSHDLSPFIFWHQKMPTIGLRSSSRDTFIPYCFNLWQLAPKKGAGIKVAVIDTGIALHMTKDALYEMHPHISYQFSRTDLFNVINFDMHYILDQCCGLLKRNHNFDVATTVLQSIIVSALHEYCYTKTVPSLIIFLKKQHAYNEKLIEDFKNMVASYQHKKYFTPFTILTKTKEPIPLILEMLPVTLAKTNISIHGIAMCGVIAGQEDPIVGPIGLAPASELIMIRAFDEQGHSNKTTLLQALRKIQEQAILIVNLSLKIADSWNYNDAVLQDIERTIASIPYVIAAAGNSNNPESMKHESYPARLASIAFDVGAYTFDDKQHYSIAPFSLYEYAIGPKFVMPGFNVLSITLSDDPDVLYGLFHGTSIAAALMTGFVALLLSEFGNYFTREQLLKVCYKATIRLHNTAEWKSKTVLGTIDMRCALFMLHVLRCFKELISKKSAIVCDFNKDFEKLVCLLHTMLYKLRDGDINLKDINANLNKTIHYVAERLILEIKSQENLIINPYAGNLFSSLSLLAQRRLNIVLNTTSL